MAIDDQAYKDALRAIESGEIPEDLDLPDPEEYDDMGGIKSLDRGAPSIKMASETGDEEFQMEIGQMLWKCLLVHMVLIEMVLKIIT